MKENNQGFAGYARVRQKPKVGETYWVQSKSYRTRATLGEDGKWRSVFKNQEVPDVVDFFFD
jgi:hypothetical protein